MKFVESILITELCFLYFYFLHESPLVIRAKKIHFFFVNIAKEKKEENLQKKYMFF